METLGDPTLAEFEAVVRGALEGLGLPLKTVALAIRVAVTGSRVGPGLFEVLAVAGPKIVAARLRAAGQEKDNR